jgi:hypothetical protein
MGAAAVEVEYGDIDVLRCCQRVLLDEDAGHRCVLGRVARRDEEDVHVSRNR